MCGSQAKYKNIPKFYRLHFIKSVKHFCIRGQCVWSIPSLSRFSDLGESSIFSIGRHKTLSTLYVYVIRIHALYTRTLRTRIALQLVLVCQRGPIRRQYSYADLPIPTCHTNTWYPRHGISPMRATEQRRRDKVRKIFLV